MIYDALSYKPFPAIPVKVRSDFDAESVTRWGSRDHARDAEDFIRTTIEQRPYTAAAVALGIGFLIGRFSRWGDD